MTPFSTGCEGCHMGNPGLSDDCEVKHIGRGSEDENLCPECRSGTLEAKQAGFVGCSNFRYC